jgi:hypothetical protein
MSTILFAWQLGAGLSHMLHSQIANRNSKLLFAYLKPALPKLLQCLAERPHPALIILDGAARPLRRPLPLHIRVESQRVDPALDGTRAELGDNGPAPRVILRV